MKITNIHDVPAPLVTLATKEYYSKGSSHYSVTELMSPPKIRRLREQYDGELEQDVSQMLWQMMGQALHVVMERGVTDGHESEERIFLEIDGITISGAIDLQKIDDDGVVITDYKFTSAWAVMREKIEWQQQLNIYRYLVEKVNGKKVKGLKVCALVRDWSRHETGKDGYPKAPVHMVDIPMWNMDAVEKYIHERLDLHRNARVSHDFNEPLPPCTDEERWMSETVFAVKREGRKSAIRLFKPSENTNAEAEANAAATKEKGYVEIRKGEPRRCTGNYCGVAHRCDQYRPESTAGASDE